MAMAVGGVLQRAAATVNAAPSPAISTCDAAAAQTTQSRRQLSPHCKLGLTRFLDRTLPLSPSPSSSSSSCSLFSRRRCAASRISSSPVSPDLYATLPTRNSLSPNSRAGHATWRARSSYSSSLCSCSCSPTSSATNGLMRSGWLGGGMSLLSLTDMMAVGAGGRSRNVRQLNKRSNLVRASTDDKRLPTGFPPMQTKPQWFWRVIAVAPYIIPVSELFLSAEGAYLLNPFIEVLEDAFWPVLVWYHGQRFLPLMTFFALFLGVVRNQQFWPHFVRYHTLNSILMEIIIMVASYLVKLLPASIAENAMIVPWVSLAFTLWITITVFYSIACAIKGMYADIPFISDAVYIQIPVDV